MEAPCKACFLLGDNDDGDYVGVGAVVHTLFSTWRPFVRPFFYLEAPCKAFFLTWRPLVRHFLFTWRSLVRLFSLFGGSL